MGSTADYIFELDDAKSLDVLVPEWPDKSGAPMRLRVRSLSGDEKDAYEDWCMKRKNNPLGMRGIRAYLVSLCTINDDGTRLFTDDQIDRLGRKSAAALDRLFDACCSLNALRSSDVEELEKN